ncbi:hypothetical protein DMB42_37775 [Nonomuraea sp. WAC 01424]|uniref:hypothetical protein n=1 Tax=Nonomuraea sp. WAC 01424 TaxID=2203200 RepID=UPI000F7A7C6C|nr:hypothetical protein [Nonomuraea sp. WAC 01424]RSN01919.1 hypothetical protein DMB42_37775 [Nonomuraea sp. WAC 01424]
MDSQGWGGGLALRPRDYLGIGEPLADVVAAAGPYGGEALHRLALGTAATMARLHLTGIAGLRLGPHNVLIGPLGEASFAPGPRSSELPPADVREWADVIVFAATGQAADGDPGLDALPDELREMIGRCRRPDPAARPTAMQLVRVLLGHSPSARHASVRELLREAEGWSGPDEWARTETRSRATGRHGRGPALI